MKKDIKEIKILSVIVGVISVIMAVPALAIAGLVYKISIIPMLATILLSWIILGESKRIKFAATASNLSMISGVLGVIGYLLMLLIDQPDGWYAQGMMGASVLLFPGWVLSIIAAVFHFINIGKLNYMQHQLPDDEVIDVDSEQSKNVIVIEESIITTIDEQQIDNSNTENNLSGSIIIGEKEKIDDK